jgi:CheY-like chemotaxis protein
MVLPGGTGPRCCSEGRGVGASQADDRAIQKDEIARLRSELNAERRVTRDMLANISHELRTPLTAILGYSDLLLQGAEGPLNDDQRADVATIDRSARRLLELIDGLADGGQAEVGEQQESPLILVVDDTRETRILMRRLLERDGLRVTEAETGEEALRQVETLRPQVVVLDLRLPHMSGLDVARRIRTHGDPAVARTVLLACSASIQPNIEAEVLAAGCDAFEPKPFDAASFASRIRGLLARHQPA